MPGVEMNEGERERQTHTEREMIWLMKAEAGGHDRSAISPFGWKSVTGRLLSPPGGPAQFGLSISTRKCLDVSFVGACWDDCVCVCNISVTVYNYITLHKRTTHVRILITFVFPFFLMQIVLTL